MPPAIATATSSAASSPGTTQLDGIAGWVVGVMEALGAPGAGLLVALENLFPPIPSEVILPLAGFTASLGQTFTLAEAIVWCTIGSVVGAWALYGVGRWLGRERVRAFMNWLPLVKIEDVDKTENWFNRHGHWTVLLGRIIPVFRSLISIPAGVTKMNLLTFTLLTLVGSLVWNTILVYAGYVLGENWVAVEPWVGTLTYVVVAVVVVLLAWWIVRRVRENRRAPTD